jgi:hypothetical protein
MTIVTTAIAASGALRVRRHSSRLVVVSTRQYCRQPWIASALPSAT